MIETYLNILKYNKANKNKKFLNKEIKILIISNTTNIFFKDIFRFFFFKNGYKLIINNIDETKFIQQSEKIKKKKYDLVFVFFDIFLTRKIKDNNLNKIKEEINCIINSFGNTVFFNSFVDAKSFFNVKVKDNKYIKKLNLYLKNHGNKNIKIVDVDRFLKYFKNYITIDKDQFKKNKIIYSSTFLQLYLYYLSGLIFNTIGCVKKVLILDCDNTLWPGILSEEGKSQILRNIELSKNKKFKSFYKLINNLKKKGILLALNSKNNFSTVKNFFNKNYQFDLKFNDFIVKKINWENKINNIVDISKELNLGTDSFVFIDDTPSELYLVEQNLKEINCFLFKNEERSFTLLLKILARIFNKERITKEDKKKHLNYNQEIKRIEFRKKFNTRDEYLNSLKMKMTISFNKLENITRYSQMTQKTNQFNFTTIRLSELDVKNKILSKSNNVISFSLKDIYGNHGTTGLIFLKTDNKKVKIENFLMSCRVFNRDAENVFFNYILMHLKKKGYLFIEGNYIKSNKNFIVKNFYKKYGFKNKNTDKFILNLEEFRPIKTLNYECIKQKK